MLDLDGQTVLAVARLVPSRYSSYVMSARRSEAAEANGVTLEFICICKTFDKNG